MATWNLFVLYNKEINYYSFFISKLESRPLPTSTNTKKAIWRLLLSKWKWSNLIGCYAQQKNCDWSRKITPPSTSLKGLPVKWKLTAKAELNCEIHKSSRKCWKIKVVFIRAVLWAEKLGWYFEFYWSWKNTLEKLAVAVNTERHSIRVLNERSV